MKKLISMSVYAGLMIGVGGLTYLRVGGLAGAVLFSFGLLSVPILAGNAVGCLMMAVVTMYATNSAVVTNLSAILEARMGASWHGLLVTAMGTGMIMTLSVYGARQKHYLLQQDYQQP